ncbi:hypothetical protein, partial [Dyella nitratireducens]|uniref:hypothetical protein n=1 Tax=Dyella nitratireducens TaxID=1849580 RepID=UPI00188C5DF9
RGFILFLARNATTTRNGIPIVVAGQEFVIAGQTCKAEAMRVMARGNVKKTFALPNRFSAPPAGLCPARIVIALCWGETNALS